MRGRGLRHRVGVRRRGFIGVVVVLAAVGASAPVAGQERGGFVPGSGQAAGRTVRIVPHAASLELAITLGRAAAAYEVATAAAESMTFDPGFWGVIATSGSCGGDPYIRPEQLPQPLRVDSRKGPAVASRDSLGGSGQGPGAGVESVWADPQPKAHAENIGASSSAGGPIVIRGGVATAEAELVPGRQRRAAAEVRLGEISLGDGLVRLTGLEWRAEHITGARGKVEGSFELGGISVAGTPLRGATPDELRSAFDRANEVLGPMGLRVELPVMTKSEDERYLDVGPLELVIGEGSGLAPIAPVFEGVVGAFRDQIQELLSCESPLGPFAPLIGAGQTVGEITIGSTMGTGSGLNFEFGGVRATTEGIAFADPFGNVPPFVLGGPVTLGGVTHSTEAFREGGSGRGPGAPGAPEAVLAGPASVTCESTHSRGRPGCSKGWWPAVLLVAGVAGGLFAADYARSRRRLAATLGST